MRITMSMMTAGLALAAFATGAGIATISGSLLEPDAGEKDVAAQPELAPALRPIDEGAVKALSQEVADLRASGGHCDA